MSGHKSGGVCIDCQHNTAGRSCDYCREGYTRDLTQPMTSINACQGSKNNKIVCFIVFGNKCCIHCYYAHQYTSQKEKESRIIHKKTFYLIKSIFPPAPVTRV